MRVWKHVLEFVWYTLRNREAIDMHARVVLLASMVGITGLLAGCGATPTEPPAAASVVHGHGTQAAGSALQRIAAKATTTPATFANAVHAIDAQIHMFDDRAGVAWGYQGSHFVLYATEDGAHTWVRQSLPPLPTDDVVANGPGGVDYVYPIVSSKRMWSLVWIDTGEAHILTTRDGGSTWSPSTFSLPAGVSQVAFGEWQGAKAGWLLFEDDASGGAAAKYLFATTDGGQAWHMVNNSQDELVHNGYAARLDFAPNGKTGLYAGVDDLTKTVNVVETIDGGLHWHTSALTLPSQATAPPVVEFVKANSNQSLMVAFMVPTANGNQLYVCTSTYGKNWTVDDLSVGQVQAMSAIAPDGLVLLELRNGEETILRSLDDGQSWYTVGHSLQGSLASAIHITLDIADPATWYILALDSKLNATLLRSQDGGMHWQVM